MNESSKKLRVAIAASGLSHVLRGVESWADDSGRAQRARGIDAITFQGSGATNPGVETLGCWKRTDSRTLKLSRILRRLGAWRLHLGSAYEIEQTTFAFNLWKRVRRSFDIVHVQDPIVALWLDRLQRWGISHPRVVFAHGTEESPSLLRKYSNLQHLAPPYLAEWEKNRLVKQLVFAVPNAVDITRFKPAEPAERDAAREAFSIDKSALVVLSVAALKISHKRLDYLMREFQMFCQDYPGKAVLVIAGATDAQTPLVLDAAKLFASTDIRILPNLPRAEVISLLKAADIFTLASLHEMFSVALLEALASGLPIACNRTPVFEYAVGSAGFPNDISQPGALAAQFGELSSPAVRAKLGAAARSRAEAVFSMDVVLQQTLAMYAEVLARD